MNAVTRSARAPSNDERRAEWAYAYFGAGLHRQLTNREPSTSRRPLPARTPLVEPASVTVAGIHSNTRPDGSGEELT